MCAYIFAFNESVMYGIYIKDCKLEVHKSDVQVFSFYSRECDTDTELKGSASTSLMKSIIGQTGGNKSK